MSQESPTSPSAPDGFLPQTGLERSSRLGFLEKVRTTVRRLRELLRRNNVNEVMRISCAELAGENGPEFQQSEQTLLEVLLSFNHGISEEKATLIEEKLLFVDGENSASVELYRRLGLCTGTRLHRISEDGQVSFNAIELFRNLTRLIIKLLSVSNPSTMFDHLHQLDPLLTQIIEIGIKYAIQLMTIDEEAGLNESSITSSRQWSAAVRGLMSLEDPILLRLLSNVIEISSSVEEHLQLESEKQTLKREFDDQITERKALITKNGSSLMATSFSPVENLIFMLDDCRHMGDRALRLRGHTLNELIGVQSIRGWGSDAYGQAGSEAREEGGAVSFYIAGDINGNLENSGDGAWPIETAQMCAESVENSFVVVKPYSNLLLDNFVRMASEKWGQELQFVVSTQGNREAWLDQGISILNGGIIFVDEARYPEINEAINRIDDVGLREKIRQVIIPISIKEYKRIRDGIRNWENNTELLEMIAGVSGKTGEDLLTAAALGSMVSVRELFRMRQWNNEVPSEKRMRFIQPYFSRLAIRVIREWKKTNVNGFFPSPSELFELIYNL